MFKNINIIKTLILFISLIALSCAGKPPTTIGNFTDCPKKPNCVSTKNSYSKSYIEPIRYTGSRVEAIKIIFLTIEFFEESRVKNAKDNFIYVEFVSEIFGFVDDVEFYFNKPGVIEFRSASRIGYSDLGVNRNRMESIRSKFNGLANSEM
jgi:uncharacterized protein (DUF1499 family)